MDYSPSRYVERLKELSVRKQTHLKDILRLTQAQSGAITDDGIDELNRLIAKKQAEIEAIDKIDEEFDVYYNRLKQVLGKDSLEGVQASGISGAKELQDVISQIMALINEIGELESRNSQAAKNLLKEFGNEVKKINQGKKVSSTYGAGFNQTPSYFIDKKN